MAVTFTLVSCVRGYHIYKNVWIPVVGETVNCEREDRNPQDPYAVGLKKDGTTVGHVPRTISCICTLLLRRGSVIEATVTGPRQYSQDLPLLPCSQHQRLTVIHCSIRSFVYLAWNSYINSLWPCDNTCNTSYKARKTWKLWIPPSAKFDPRKSWLGT